MRIDILKSEISGKAVAPPSKSYTHRALVCSALADGRSQIVSPLYADDTEDTLRLLTEIGVEIGEGRSVWEVDGGDLTASGSELFCGESGTTLRFMTALCSLIEGRSVLTGGPSLSRRPIGPLIDCLRLMGVDCSCERGRPPVMVRGVGRIRGGGSGLRGDVSSQFVSAVLLVAPLAEEGATLRLSTPLESKPYVSMTIDAQRRFGVEVEASREFREFHVERQSYIPTRFSVEGDWSSAAYLLAAGALSGRVTVEGLRGDSVQADASIVGILDKMGASVEAGGGRTHSEKSELRCVELDLSDCPDLFPVVAVLCAFAEGRSSLSGLSRLRYKESDRLAVMVNALRLSGIEVTMGDDRVFISGGSPKGARFSPSNDHRIAMAQAVLGLASDGETTIPDAECVSKSYPGFWGAMEALGARLRRVDDE